MSSVWMQPKLDKLWRDGLFYKLMPRTEAGVWRILHQYYDESFAVVNVEGFRSSAFKIDEGVKQGGILSSFLFNFFLDDLLNRLLSMIIGALLGDVNASAIAYCDDILLLASNEGQMQRLINCCADYAKLWKLSFNPLKSSCYSIKSADYEFILNGGSIPKSEGFIYLGLPVGTEAFVEAFYNEKMSKCEKALYSLKNIGCNPNRLHPLAIGFIYKQYCQSIMKFGFEFVYLRKSFLSKLDIRQNILLKNILGIHHRARFKVVLNIMKVEQVSLLYEKHKVFGWRQCTKNSLTEKIFDNLSLVNSKNKLSNLSYLNQLSLVVGSKELVIILHIFGSKELGHTSIQEVLSQISEKYVCFDVELKEKVVYVMDHLNSGNSYVCIRELNSILKVDSLVNNSNSICI